MRSLPGCPLGARPSATWLCLFPWRDASVRVVLQDMRELVAESLNVFNHSLRVKVCTVVRTGSPNGMFRFIVKSKLVGLFTYLMTYWAGRSYPCSRLHENLTWITTICIHGDLPLIHHHCLHNLLHRSGCFCGVMSKPTNQAGTPCAGISTMLFGSLQEKWLRCHIGLLVTHHRSLGFGGWARIGSGQSLSS